MLLLAGVGRRRSKINKVKRAFYTARRHRYKVAASRRRLEAADIHEPETVSESDSDVEHEQKVIDVNIFSDVADYLVERDD